MQVLLAKHKADNKFYAVKVLQKKVILKKKEVRLSLHALTLTWTGCPEEVMMRSPSDIQCLHGSRKSAAPG